MNKTSRQAHAHPGQEAAPGERTGSAKKFNGSLTDDQLASSAFLAKSLSDANRLRILLLLTDGKRSVSAIVDQLCLSQALVSHHLKELRRSLLVTVERQGPFIYYALSDDRIINVIERLNAIAGQLLASRKTF